MGLNLGKKLRELKTQRDREKKAVNMARYGPGGRRAWRQGVKMASERERTKSFAKEKVRQARRRGRELARTPKAKTRDLSSIDLMAGFIGSSNKPKASDNDYIALGGGKLRHRNTGNIINAHELAEKKIKKKKIAEIDLFGF